MSTRIEYRIVHLDISGGQFAVCEITLDEQNRPIGWSNAGIKIRAKSTDGIIHHMHHLQAARDKALLVESVLNAQGVPFGQER